MSTVKPMSRKYDWMGEMYGDFLQSSASSGKIRTSPRNPAQALLWILGENQVITDPNTKRVDENRLPNQTDHRQNRVSVATAEDNALDSLPMSKSCKNLRIVSSR